MATIVRQPFAPLNEARLQTLTSLKNRQNAISNTSPSKRKASDVTASDNLENVDPVSFSKRTKGVDGFFPTKEAFIKPPAFLLTRPTKELSAVNSPKTAAPRPRSLLNPKSPSAQRDATISRSSLPASVSRAPTRKRSGLVSSRKRTAGSFTRIDPPAFGQRASSSVAPFSLDAALKGTIASYSSREDVSSQLSSGTSSFRGLNEPEVKSSWFFDIHEDTEAEEAANMLQHGACTLDISSDEECEERQQRERAEGKENLPPADDVSQTSYPRAARHAPHVDEMAYEKERSPLGEMDPTQYYSDGCDENSIIIVPGDDDDTVAEEYSSFTSDVNSAEPELDEEEAPVSAEELMQKIDDFAPSAADESFEVWESSSAKDEAEAEAEAEAAVECC